MLRNPTLIETEESQHEGTDSSGASAPGSDTTAALDSNQADQHAPAFGLAHTPMLEAERCQLWHEQYKPKRLITDHLTTECARSSLLADQVAAFREAELENQAKIEEYKWTRRQRRAARYLGVKIKTRAAEAVEQLLTFAECDRLLALAVRVREEIDTPSLCQALNRVCILNDASARRAAHAHTEARVTFTRASKDLVKALEHDEENGAGRGSDAGQTPPRRQGDEIFPAEAETASDALIGNQDEIITSVDAQVSGSGCAKLRNTGAQGLPEAAQTRAEGFGYPSDGAAFSRGN